jgi:Rha family phage regulatory protein
MTEQIRLPVLSVKDGSVVANSRDVAAYFLKEVRHVHEAIRNLGDYEPEFVVANFRPFKINDLTGQSTSHYEITKDGFTLLAMGFTGERALKFKIAYINQFNVMEAEIRRREATPARPSVPDSAEMEFVRLACRVKGERFADALWDSMGFYCPPGHEPLRQGNLFQPANQNISISISHAA